MGNGIQFHQILAIVIMVHTATGTLVPTKFRKLDERQSVTGKLGAELTTRSKIQCSDRCSSDIGCKAYRYKDKAQVNCFLIHNNFTAAEGQIIEEDDSSTLYEKGVESSSQLMCQGQSTAVGSDTWKPPDGWSGPCQALYSSFDTSASLVLMEGNNPMGDIPLVTGKINSALSLDRTKNQWVDLGIHTDICMTRPETCSAAGGAISLLVTAHYCQAGTGIISSAPQTASVIFCANNRLHMRVSLPDGSFEVDHPIQPIWTHFVLNFFGSSDGTKMFMNGLEVKHNTSKNEVTLSPGDGRIVVGRWYTNYDGNYISMLIDEVIYFNKALSNDKILLLSQ